jgi:hypothetical protein
MPSACVYDRFVPSKVDTLVTLAKENADKGKTRSVGLILDDCMYDKQAFKSIAMRSLFYNGRHSKIFCAIACQYAVDMAPDLRSQVDYVFVLKEGNISNRIKLWKMFFGAFSTYEDFAAVLDKCTQNYECLVLDNTGTSTAVTDCIYWYRATTDLPEFKIGSQVYYDLEDKMRRPPGTAPGIQIEEFTNGSNKSKRKLNIIKEHPGEEEDEDTR